MRRLATLLAVLAALLWSGVVWGGYALLAGAGAFVAANAGAVGLPAEAAEVAAWAQLLFDSFGQGTAIVLWLLGLALIGIVFAVVNAVAGRLAPAAGPRFDGRTPPPAQAPAPTPASAPRGGSGWGRNASRR